MMKFLLNKASIITCPHGGRVIPTIRYGASYLVEGQPVCVKEDSFGVYGCSMIGNHCHSVKWLEDSSAPLISGRYQALTNASIGVCLDSRDTPMGNAILQLYQTKVSTENFKSR